MGDADLARDIDHVIPAEDVNHALHALDDDLLHLQDNLNDLEERMIRQLCLHMKIYMVFQCFIMSMNFVLIPILMAQAFTYILVKLVALGPQNPLHAISSVLWFVAASVGVPLYLGSIWAIFRLPDPESLIDENVDLSSFLMIEEFGRLGRLTEPFNGILLDEDDESGEDYEELDEVHDFPLNERDGNEESSDKEAEARVLRSIMAHVQNKSDLPSESSNVSESTISNSAITSKLQEDSIDNEDDKKSLKLLSQVDEEPIVPEMDDMQLLQFCNVVFGGSLHGVKDKLDIKKIN